MGRSNFCASQEWLVRLEHAQVFPKPPVLLLSKLVIASLTQNSGNTTARSLRQNVGLGGFVGLTAWDYPKARGATPILSYLWGELLEASHESFDDHVCVHHNPSYDGYPNYTGGRFCLMMVHELSRSPHAGQKPRLHGIQLDTRNSTVQHTMHEHTPQPAGKNFVLGTSEDLRL